MKILIHFNHGVDKSVLFVLDRKATEGKLRGVLESKGAEQLIQDLVGYSSAMIEIDPTDRKRFELLADFTLSQHGYTSERLA